MVYIMLGSWRMITIAVQKYLERYPIHWFIYLFIYLFKNNNFRGGQFLWCSHDGDWLYEGLAKID